MHKTWQEKWKKNCWVETVFDHIGLRICRFISAGYCCSTGQWKERLLQKANEYDSGQFRLLKHQLRRQASNYSEVILNNAQMKVFVSFTWLLMNPIMKAKSHNVSNVTYVNFGSFVVTKIESPMTPNVQRVSRCVCLQSVWRQRLNQSLSSTCNARVARVIADTDTTKLGVSLFLPFTGGL